MNERILELAMQANSHHNFSDLNYRELDVFLEKFAELIVAECANAIVNDSRLNDVRSAANGCVRTIKQHFGVEE